VQSYCERLIDRFGLLWGKQKVLSNFGKTTEEIDQAKAAWEAQLRSVPPDTIRMVLDHLQRDPPDWPPSLAQWIQLCKQFRAAEHKPAALPLPKQVTEAGREIIESAVSQMRTAGFDYLHWAKYPKSAQAILLLARGAREDTRLADILAQHIADGGANCQPEARKQLAPIIESRRVSVSV
jgi:hypothetical protein